METHHNLSASESIYFGGYVHPVTLTVVKESTPEAVIKPIYRRLGRKKLTPDQMMARDEREQERQEDCRNMRLQERQRREDAKLLALQQKRERSIELHNQKLHQEKLQSLRNKKNAPVLPEDISPDEIYIQGAPLAAGVFAAAGVPAMPGYTAVRINVKTAIYVKYGHDIPTAVASYKNKHGLI
jgi:hypothetical protein